ncbi:hypothetical protein NHH82_25520 [Oxalobacteraceae bacterium OTU3REALA1]|nr:hypothetical protein NHH82_25520 [Oxalobacteraceae bacterium OTU3REALA1]
MQQLGVRIKISFPTNSEHQLNRRKIRLDIISIAIALATLAFSTAALNGVFSGGQSHCGTYSLDCVGIAGVLMLIGTSIGLATALTSLTRSGVASWGGWIGLFLNGVPALFLLVLALQIAMR